MDVRGAFFSKQPTLPCVVFLKKKKQLVLVERQESGQWFGKPLIPIGSYVLRTLDWKQLYNEPLYNTLSFSCTTMQQTIDALIKNKVNEDDIVTFRRRYAGKGFEEKFSGDIKSKSKLIKAVITLGHQWLGMFRATLFTGGYTSTNPIEAIHSQIKSMEKRKHIPAGTASISQMIDILAEMCEEKRKWPISQVDKLKETHIYFPAESQITPKRKDCECVHSRSAGLTCIHYPEMDIFAQEFYNLESIGGILRQISFVGAGLRGYVRPRHCIPFYIEYGKIATTQCYTGFTKVLVKPCPNTQSGGHNCVAYGGRLLEKDMKHDSIAVIRCMSSRPKGHSKTPSSSTMVVKKPGTSHEWAVCSVTKKTSHKKKSPEKRRSKEAARDKPSSQEKNISIEFLKELPRGEDKHHLRIIRLGLCDYGIGLSLSKRNNIKAGKEGCEEVFFTGFSSNVLYNPHVFLISFASFRDEWYGGGLLNLPQENLTFINTTRAHTGSPEVGKRSDGRGQGYLSSFCTHRSPECAHRSPECAHRSPECAHRSPECAHRSSGPRLLYGESFS
ncbi:hypothetical protein ADUPG1_013397 [Aduncisulcus paluster]|uniref:Uncharacterized protein n=1 Tax=Aduncisulcus paluster TaxID=2918883 RepID=A0ABQ5K2T3_9EUKA|nr:hypothetical protein ADUPG1_013397 [Aduncisulcus paluster]